MSRLVSLHSNGGLQCSIMLSLMCVSCFVSSNLGIWTIELARVEWIMSYDSSETYINLLKLFIEIASLFCSWIKLLEGMYEMLNVLDRKPHGSCWKCSPLG